jgi:hypothetical protein
MISNSQCGQDLYVLEKLNYKKNGFFVELGASDGIQLSNTYILEKDLNWTGILIEPSSEFNDLIKNRKSICFNECVSDKIAEEIFIEGLGNDNNNWENNNHFHLSSLQKCFEQTLNVHGNNVRRIQIKDGISKKIITTTLDLLLDKGNAPSIIDYLSLDVEGNEYNILKNFPFEKYNFRIITVEHNGAEPNRTLIHELLLKNKYLYDTCLGNLDDVYVYNI